MALLNNRGMVNKEENSLWVFCVMTLQAAWQAVRTDSCRTAKWKTALTVSKSQYLCCRCSSLNKLQLSSVRGGALITATLAYSYSFLLKANVIQWSQDWRRWLFSLCTINTHPTNRPGHSIFISYERVVYMYYCMYDCVWLCVYLCTFAWLCLFFSLLQKEQ